MDFRNWATTASRRSKIRRAIWPMKNATTTASNRSDECNAISATSSSRPGGAHLGDPRILAEHFVSFIPSCLSISPITHTYWEGVGVLPDIKASAKNALDVAHKLALKDALAVEKDPEIKEVLTQCVDELK